MQNHGGLSYGTQLLPFCESYLSVGAVELSRKVRYNADVS